MRTCRRPAWSTIMWRAAFAGARFCVCPRSRVRANRASHVQFYEHDPAHPSLLCRNLAVVRSSPRVLKKPAWNGSIRGGTSGLGCSPREVFQTADRYVRHEHHSRVAGEQRLEARQDGLDFLRRDHAHEHNDAVHLVEHRVSAMEAVVAFTRNIVDDGVAGRFIVEQIGRKFEMLALDDDPDLFHWM